MKVHNLRARHGTSFVRIFYTQSPDVPGIQTCAPGLDHVINFLPKMTLCSSAVLVSKFYKFQKNIIIPWSRIWMHKVPFQHFYSLMEQISGKSTWLHCCEGVPKSIKAPYRCMVQTEVNIPREEKILLFWREYYST